MELKKKTENGECQVLGCAHQRIALAKAKTFFSSRRRGNIELCEDHLFRAQEMADQQGLTLVYEEIAAQPEQSEQSEVSLVTMPSQDKLKTELSAEATNAEQLMAELNSFEIISKEDLEFAAEALTETKQNLKRLDDKRKEISGPLNEALRAANGLFKPAISFYQECEKLLKSKIAAAAAKADQVAREALQTAGEAAGQGDAEGLTTALEVHDQASEFPVTSGVQYRTSWKFEVTDEKLVPREYLTVNMRLVQSVVTHKKGDTDIPGIRAFEEKIIASV